MDSSIINQIASSQPTIKFCSLFNGLSPLWDYSLHKHPYMELIYRKKGFGKTVLLDDTQHFVFFDTLVYPVDCWHQDKFNASEENEAYCLWLDIPCVPLDKSIQVQDRGGRLEFLFRYIYEEYQKSNASPELLLQLIRSLLIQIILLSEENKPSIVDRVVQYLHVHMTEKITLDKLVSVFFTSKSFLVKHFKQETGKTIIEYLNSIRIDTAKMLLMTTAKSIEEISETVGYESPKYFARIFKSTVGTSPSAFCKQQKHEETAKKST